MLLKIIHQTDLSYTDMISETVMELRMCPKQEQHQHRLAFDLAIGPKTRVTSYFDWLGNLVHAFTVNGFHRQLRIIATSVVEVTRRAAPLEELPDLWPLPGGLPYTLYDSMHFDGPIEDSAALREVARGVQPADGTPLAKVVMRMVDIIHRVATYEKGKTNAASPVSDILDHGRGVCQDFAHLMIALCRALGIPARYISGFVHPDRPGYVGDMQTHAWCEIMFPSAGWIGVDPTNRCIVGGNFVKLATGRHYRDVPPNRGLYRGVADETMDVVVNTQPLDAIPGRLPAERMQSLEIPVYAGIREARRADLQWQQEQQQQ